MYGHEILSNAEMMLEDFTYSLRKVVSWSNEVAVGAYMNSTT